MNTQNVKLAAAYVSRQVYDFIILYAMVAKKSRSAVIREILGKWERSGSLKEELEGNVIQKIQNEWFKVKLDFVAGKNGELCSRSNFLEDKRKELQEKGLSKETVERIINEIRIQ